MPRITLSPRRLLGTTCALAALAALALVPAGRGAAPPRPDPGKLTARPAADAVQPPTLSVGQEVRTTAGQRCKLALPDGSALYVNERSTARLVEERQLDLLAGEVFVEVAPRPGEPFLVKAPGRQVKATGTHFAVRSTGRGARVVVASGEVRVGGVEVPVRAGQALEEKSDRPTPAPRVSYLLGWVRDLMDAPALVPASAHAGGSLTARTPEGQEAKLALRKYHVDVHVEDGFARTTIDQTFFNDSDERLEGTFRFPLPPDASLSRLAMYVDGTLMEGGMAERDYARNVYERIVNQQRDPALLEWVDGSTFKMRVFPLEPRQEKRILLSYSQRLPSLYGSTSYRFPAGHSLSRVARWSLHVRVKGGGELAWDSPSHSLSARKDKGDLLLEGSQKDARLDRDVVLSLSEPTGARAEGEGVRFSCHQQDGSGYLMLRYRPGLEAKASPQRRDWVFLVETSADRDPLLARTQIEVVRGLLALAGPSDSFGLLTCSTRPRSFRDDLLPATPEHAEKALAFLENAHLIGALDLGKGLEGAATLLKRTKNPWLVHVGSATPALGTRANEELVKKLPEGTRYVGVGVGKRWNRPLMKLAAERSAGHFTQVNPDENVSWRGFDLSATLNTPRLLDVAISDPAGKWTFLPFVRAVAQGEELAAVARADKGTPLPETVEVGGTVEGKAFARALKVEGVATEAGYLPRTWASLEIERLLAEDASKNKPGIVELSKAMYVMTPFTSLLVLENEDMYRQFKVDRGRKDHWALYPAPAKIAVVKEGGPGAGKLSRNEVRRTVVVRQRPAALNQGQREGEVPPVELQSTMGRTRLAAAASAAPNMIGDGDEPAVYFPSVAGNAPAGDTPERLEPAMLEGLVMKQARVGGLGALGALGGGLGALGGGLALGSGALGLNVGGQLGAQIGGVQIGGFAGGELGQLGNLGSSGEDLPEAALALVRQKKELRPSPLAVDWAFGLDPVTGKPVSEQPSIPLLYSRPVYSANDALFSDLLAHAPGLNTSAADVLAVLDAEARPSAELRVGKVDPKARAVVERARQRGWTRLALGDRVGEVVFDGQGRYAWERTLPGGLRERVACDGTTLWHLYRELGLAARRTLSRAHRLDFQRLVPLALPQAEDLAHGADLVLRGPRTLALVPHQKGAPTVEWTLTEGDVTERRLLDSDGKVRLREKVEGGKLVRLDGEGKELLSRSLGEAEAPALKPDTENLVVLELPFRTPDHVRKALKIEKKAPRDLTFAEATALLSAFVAVRDSSSALALFREGLYARDERKIGYYVLLAAAGVRLEGESAADVQAEHPDEPLAQYLALHSSPTLRTHAAQWAAGGAVWPEGLLRRLALGHALCQRWQGRKSLGTTAAQRKAERERALGYVRRYQGSDLAWALLGVVQDRLDAEERRGGLTDELKGAYRELAGAWKLFEGHPLLGELSRYEQARCLGKAGEKAEAARRFRSLYDSVLARGHLPRIDGDLRSALLEAPKGEEDWSGLLKRTSSTLVGKRQRYAVLKLAEQCWQLDDHAAAERLLERALEGAPGGTEGLVLTVQAVAFLSQAGQYGEADALLRRLLADPEHAGRPSLWRLREKLARDRSKPALALECLERALDLEYREAPAVVNLEGVREGYRSLLGSYSQQAEAVRSLRLALPAGFKEKVVRAADRWRELDRDSSEPARTAADILYGLGERELAWDYQTTPLALQPGEAAPLTELAQGLSARGEWALADRAYESAFAAEPTDARLLWDRAQNLRRSGQVARARAVYRQLADGSWQPRFEGLKQQARALLEGS